MKVLQKKIRKIVFALICSSILVGQLSVASAENVSSGATTDDAIYKEIGELVQGFYNKATVKVNDKGVEFRFKVKTETGFYSSRPVEVPSDGGILGSVNVVPGEFKGKEKNLLPFEERCGYYTKLLMAPYSRKQDAHLLAHLSFPEGTPNEFKEKFKELINRFNAGEEPSVDQKQSLDNSVSASTPVVQESSNLPDKVCSGVLQERREKLLQELKEAKEKGVGIAAYAAEFNRIEDSLKNSAAEIAVGKKIDSLTKILKHQQESSAGPSSSSSAAPSTTGSSSGLQLSGGRLYKRQDGSEVLTAELQSPPRMPFVPLYSNCKYEDINGFRKKEANGTHSEGFSLKFKSSDSKERVWDFFSKSLTAQGWRIDEIDAERNNLSARRGEAYINLSLDTIQEASNKCKVSMSYNNNPHNETVAVQRQSLAKQQRTIQPTKSNIAIKQEPVLPRLPVYPNRRFSSGNYETIVGGDGYTSTEYGIRYETTDSPEQVSKFYRAQLAKAGWSTSSYLYHWVKGLIGEKEDEGFWGRKSVGSFIAVYFDQLLPSSLPMKTGFRIYYKNYGPARATK